MRSKVFLGGVLDGPDVRDSRVVHQDIDVRRIAVGIDAREGSFHRLSERDVAFERRRGASGGANTLDDGGRCLEIAIENENACAVAGKRRRDCQADSRASASHNRDLSVESKHDSNSKTGEC